MFRNINLKNNSKSKDKLILMKNSREEFCEIPIEYINEIAYEFMQPDVMTLTIPNKATHNGQTIYNHVFDKILGKRQQIKFNGYTYVITECDREDKRDKKVKNITAKSYDITLEDSYLYTPMGGMMSHLVKKEGEYEISDGYLDTFVKENPMWKIGHIDDSCRTELNKVSVEQDRELNNMSFDNVGFDTVLFNQTFEGINPINENSTVGLRISFRNIELYDPTTNKLLNTVTKVCDLGLFHIGVKNVKATFITTDAYRYAIDFEVTLTDNTVLSRVCEFVDIKGYNMRCSNGVLLFTDGTLETVSMLKYRNLEENTYSWRNVLVEYLTEAFDCFIVFDNKNMTVNAYDKKTFGENKGVYLSYDNFVKGINKSYQYDQIITKLIVESEEEDLSITDENPLGTDYILNYDYFIDNEIMSEQCAKAWKLYEGRIDGVQGGLYDLRVELNTKNSLKIKLDTEVLSLEENIKGLEAIRVGYVKQNDAENAQRLSKEINEKYDRVAEIVKELSVVGDEISNLKKQIEVTTKSITMEEALDDNGDKIFTDEDLLEIQSLTISETYTDKYYLTAYGLYNNSLEILKERNKLQIDFTVDLVGLLQNIIIPNGLTWDYYIKIGDKVNLEDDEIEGDIRIVKITYIPKDFKVTSVSFTNKDREVDDLKAIGNIGRTIGRLDTVTNTYKPEWIKGIDASKYVNDMLNYGLNLKATGIRSRSYSVKTDFSESGLFVIDGTNENRQLFLAGGIMAITNDRFETLKVCIDTDGLVAETIVGRLLVGQNLIIANENNSMIIDNEGITIESNKLTIKGIEGEDYSFTSYFGMINNQISLKVSKGEVVSAINQTAETVKINANKIQLEGATTIAGESGDRVKINNANYEIINGDTSKAFFGLRQIDDGRLVPRMALSHSGLDISNNNYFVMTAHARGDNPLGVDSSYIDLAYRCQEYKLPDNTGDVSNIRMISNGDIQLSAIKETVIRSNMKNGVTSTDGTEYEVGKFSSSGSDYFDGNLQIDCVRNIEDRENGLVLADYGKGSDNATVIRIATDNDGTKFVRPVDTKKDIRLGSPSNAWYNVYTSMGTYSSEGIISSDVVTMSEDYSPRSNDDILDNISFSKARMLSNNNSLQMDVSDILNTCYIQKSEDNKETYINTHEMVKLLIYEVKKLKIEKESLEEKISELESLIID